MKTVLSRTGIEVLYQCTVHFLNDGVLECEYKSNSLGSDLLDYICEYISIVEKEYWGLNFHDSFNQRHWLETNKLIRVQVKNVCPIHFHFKVKVYPPEPYKSLDTVSKHHIFLQLKKDLLNSSLYCGPSDSALLLALVLQHTYGDYDSSVAFETYVAKKIIQNQTISTELKAIELHKNHLNGLSKTQIEDLLLRMVCQLETYGIDPFLVESEENLKLTLWINHRGMVTYIESKKVQEFNWLGIRSIFQSYNNLIIQLVNDKKVIFTCSTQAECDYIFQCAIAHLEVFTSTGAKSTIGIIESVSAESIDNVNLDVLKIIEDKIEEDLYVYDSLTDGLEYRERNSSKWKNPCSIKFCAKMLTYLLVIVGIIWQLYSIWDENLYLAYKKRFRKIVKSYIPNKLFRI